MVNASYICRKMEYEIWIGADEQTVKEYRESAVKTLGSLNKTKDATKVTDEEDEGAIR